MRKATIDYNFGKVCPDLAKEWHSSRNDALTPFEVCPRATERSGGDAAKGTSGRQQSVAEVILEMVAQSATRQIEAK